MEVALDGFITALKVAEAIANERWDVNVMPVHMLYRGEGEPIFVPFHHHQVTLDELKTWAEGMEFTIASMLIIAMDSALKETFGAHPLNDPDVERRAVRCIIYLIRCSSAHDPIRPVWNISSGYNRVWEVPSLGIHLNGPAVNAIPVKASHYGGWSKLKTMTDYVLNQLS